jgi:hypothetical protein
VKRGLESGGKVINIVGAVTRKLLATDGKYKTVGSSEL